MDTIKRILLVDDDLNDVELTLTALAESNLANEVVVAHDGAEALDYLYRRGKFAARQDGLPAVVLLDLKMLKVSGIEVLRQIKADADLQLLPVVILTSSREATDLEQCYQLGVNAYVVKPVQIQDFMHAIKQVGMFWAVINELPPSIRKMWTPHPEATTNLVKHAVTALVLTEPDRQRLAAHTYAILSKDSLSRDTLKQVISDAATPALITDE